VTCPDCGLPLNRFQAPLTFQNVVLRRHKCPNCRGKFVSAQLILTGDLAEQIGDLAEERTKPTPSSEEKPPL
jgi:hypothetical protein